MSHTRVWINTTPLDTAEAGDGALEIRKLKEDFKERFELDHNFDGILDTTIATADGYHKKVTLKVLTSDPAVITDSGILYAKSDGLYFRNSAGIVKVI